MSDLPAQSAPAAGMVPTVAAESSHSAGDRASVQVWVGTLDQGCHQIRALFTQLKRIKKGTTWDRDASELPKREASTRSFLFYLEHDFPAEKYALLKTKVYQHLKFVQDHRTDDVFPVDMTDKCEELFAKFEQENWGAQETAAAEGEEANAQDESMEALLPPPNHAIWGLRGIMHGLIVSASGIRKSYRFDPRYISEKRDAKVFGHNGLNPGDWWPLQHVALFHGAHGAKQKGIAGHPEHGAWSIVVSEYAEYESLDKDEGERLLYSGDDTRNKKNKDEMVAVSTLNQSMQKSLQTGKPVRVLRSSGAKNRYAPSVGIRYDGLYHVVAEFERTRVQGGKFMQFELVRLPGQRAFAETIRAAPTAQQKADYEKYKELY